VFPISRDPPEGGTVLIADNIGIDGCVFPISRDPPEGGTACPGVKSLHLAEGFQFLGIPPKGELLKGLVIMEIKFLSVSNF